MDKILLIVGSAAVLIWAGWLYAGQKKTVEFLNSGKVLPATLPFSEAVRVDDMLYLSGHIGNEPGAPKLVPGGMREEAKQAMENVKASLEAHGYSTDNLVKYTVILADMSEWAIFNEVYKTFFTARYPRRGPPSRQAALPWAHAWKSNASLQSTGKASGPVRVTLRKVRRLLRQ